jgi:hypothetical protein
MFQRCRRASSGEGFLLRLNVNQTGTFAFTRW